MFSAVIVYRVEIPSAICADWTIGYFCFCRHHHRAASRKMEHKIWNNNNTKNLMSFNARVNNTMHPAMVYDTDNRTFFPMTYNNNKWITIIIVRLVSVVWLIFSKRRRKNDLDICLHTNFDQTWPSTHGFGDNFLNSIIAFRLPFLHIRNPSFVARGIEVWWIYPETFPGALQRLVPRFFVNSAAMYFEHGSRRPFVWIVSLFLDIRICCSRRWRSLYCSVETLYSAFVWWWWMMVNVGTAKM